MKKTLPLQKVAYLKTSKLIKDGGFWGSSEFEYNYERVRILGINRFYPNPFDTVLIQKQNGEKAEVREQELFFGIGTND